MQDPLKLGFFIQPVHPPCRPYADVLREDREAVVLADRLGYREAFIGEHLVDAAETITSSLAFIASLADACPSITFGTGVLPLANYHPAMAAAQVAMVDHLVHGRLVLGVGPGVRPDAEAIGDLGSDRNRKTQEALEHMCRIWSEEPPYRIEGEFYRTTTKGSVGSVCGTAATAAAADDRIRPDAPITSIPRNSRGPARGGSSPQAQRGLGQPGQRVYVVRAHVQSYLEGRRSAGLPEPTPPLRVGGALSSSPKQAARARHYAHRGDSAHGFFFHVMKT